MPETNALPPHSTGDELGVLERSLALVRYLRAGCPWDAAQTPVSLTPYLLEESIELADAIIEGADDETLRSEIGDVLLNIAFQIVLAEERGAFNAGEVLSALEEKMRRRHPHLYGDAGPRPDWEREKAAERPGTSVFEGLASLLDPLSRAQRLQDRASGVGFDWQHSREAFAKVREEVEEVAEHLETAERDALEAEIGDLLFAVVNVARLADVHAATALKLANVKFEGRFNRVAELADRRGLRLGEASLEELDRLWDEVKQGESSEP